MVNLQYNTFGNKLIVNSFEEQEFTSFVDWYLKHVNLNIPINPLIFRKVVFKDLPLNLNSATRLLKLLEHQKYLQRVVFNERGNFSRKLSFLPQKVPKYFGSLRSKESNDIIINDKEKFISLLVELIEFYSKKSNN